MSRTELQEIGRWGEEQASLFLVRNKYEVATRNYLARGGEIDIVAWDRSDKDEPALCFVEVKTRSEGEDSAELAVNKEKAQKIKSTAENYCYFNRIDVDNTRIRFEHVSVYVDKENKKISFKKYILPSFLFDRRPKFRR
ncbi:MAG: YraN family protein [Candidatus Magasanikbacteria bacterium]|nr:YraN family protein [Candidatus Magasanikbacteria bacterium]